MSAHDTDPPGAMTPMVAALAEAQLAGPTLASLSAQNAGISGELIVVQRELAKLGSRFEKVEGLGHGIGRLGKVQIQTTKDIVDLKSKQQMDDDRETARVGGARVWKVVVSIGAGVILPVLGAGALWLMGDYSQLREQSSSREHEVALLKLNSTRTERVVDVLSTHVDANRESARALNDRLIRIEVGQTAILDAIQDRPRGR